MKKRVALLLVVGVLGLGGLAGVLVAPGCAPKIERRDATGMAFPVVNGNALDGTAVELPTDYLGEPVVLLIGYLQRSQFDIDRWILGLLQAEVGVRIVEVPTIPGLAASLAGGFIDEGMRSGIPDGDWGIVVTVYGSDAEPIVEMTGNEGGQTARVLLLDGEGNVVWFWDDGYSARLALEVKAAVEELRAEAATGGDDPVE